MGTKVLFLVVMLGLECSGYAQTQNTLNLNQAINQIWGEAPQLKAIDEQRKIAEKDLWRRFLPNEPSLSYEQDDSDRSRSTGVSLTMGFPGKAFALSKLDHVQLQNLRRDAEVEKITLAHLVTQAYLACASAQKGLLIRQNSLKEVEKHLANLSSRRGAPRIEKLSFELEVRQSRHDLATAQDQLSINCQKLATLLDEKAPLGDLEMPEDLPTEVIKALGSQTVEEKRLTSSLDLAEVSSQTALWSQMPDFTLSYSEKQFVDNAEDGSRPKYGVLGVSVSLPIFFPFHESIEAQRIRAANLLEKSRAAIEKLHIKTQKEQAAHDYLRLRNQLQEIRKKDLPLAKAIIESSESAYRSGQIGYAEMVLSRKSMIDLKLREIDLQAAIVEARFSCLESCELKSAGSKGAAQ